MLSKGPQDYNLLFVYCPIWCHTSDLKHLCWLIRSFCLRIVLGWLLIRTTIYATFTQYSSQLSDWSLTSQLYDIEVLDWCASLTSFLKDCFWIILIYNIGLHKTVQFSAANFNYCFCWPLDAHIIVVILFNVVWRRECLWKEVYSWLCNLLICFFLRNYHLSMNYI